MWVLFRAFGFFIGAASVLCGLAVLIVTLVDTQRVKKLEYGSQRLLFEKQNRLHLQQSSPLMIFGGSLILYLIYNTH